MMLKNLLVSGILIYENSPCLILSWDNSKYSYFLWILYGSEKIILTISCWRCDSTDILYEDVENLIIRETELLDFIVK